MWQRRSLLLAAVASLGIAGAVPTGATASTRLAYETGTVPLTSIWLANLGGKHRRRLGPGQSPVVSPDGRYVAALSRSLSPSWILLYPTAGGRVRRFQIPNPGPPSLIGWAPGSRYLLAISDSGSSVAVGAYVIDVRTGSIRFVAPGAGWASFDTNRPDRLVYNFNRDLFAVNPSGGDRRQLTHDHRDGLHLVWDRGQIVFDRGTNIWIMSSDGSRQRMLYRNNSVSYFLPIREIGATQVLVASSEGEAIEYGALSLRTGRLRLLRLGPESSVTGVSRNGRRLLVEQSGVAGSGRIESFPLDGATPTILVNNAYSPSWNA